MGPSSILQTVLALAVCFSTSVASDTNDSYCLRTEAGSSLHDALSIVYRIANERPFVSDRSFLYDETTSRSKLVQNLLAVIKRKEELRSVMSEEIIDAVINDTCSYLTSISILASDLDCHNTTQVEALLIKLQILEKMRELGQWLNDATVEFEYNRCTEKKGHINNLYAFWQAHIDTICSTTGCAEIRNRLFGSEGNNFGSPSPCACDSS